MQRNVKVVLGGVALSLGFVMGMPTAAFAVTCTVSGYSQVCVPTPPTIPDNVTPPVVTPPSVGGGTTSPGVGGVTPPTTPGTVTPVVGGGTTSPGTVETPAATGGSVGAARGAVESLPFTGDEILVLGIAGAAALAAGAALTVAGRRRGAITA